MISRFDFTDRIPPEAIRQPTVAGKFYPADPKILENEIRHLLTQAGGPEVRGKLFALIAPHAGYQYSGGVAAHAHRLLSGSAIKTIVVIAPSHFEKFPFVSVFIGKSYRTPLGELPVDQSFAEKVLDQEKLFAPIWSGHREAAHGAEHALEVQLPFLQKTLPACAIVPLVMGRQNWTLCEKLGIRLAELAKENSFIILASTDLSHYYAQAQAVELDKRFMDLLAAKNPWPLYQALTRGSCQACGAGPVLATMIAAQRLQADQVDLLCYRTSGEVSGDFSRVVGYLAASFSRAA